MRQNSAMRSLVSKPGAPAEIPEELADILAGGWYTADCGALLLVYAGAHARSWPCEARAVAQREYEVNDIRVPGLDLNEDRETFLFAITRRACEFSRAALRLAAGSRAAESLTAVISVGIDDDYLSQAATVKFFTMRGDYPDWFDDLESFKSEAIMLLQAGDLRTFPD